MLFAAAVERDGSRGFGRARLAVIQDASAASRRTFLVDDVQSGARVITDGWSSYPAATRELYEHEPTTVSTSGHEAHEVLPAVHTVCSLIKRWVMGTLQGSVNYDEQLSGFSVGIEDALRPNEPASIVGIEVQVISVDAGPDARSGLTARVSRDGTTYEVALADLQLKADSELGLIVASYRRGQGRTR